MLFSLIISGQSFSCVFCFPFLLSSRAWNCLLPQRWKKQKARFIHIFHSLDAPVGKQGLEVKILKAEIILVFHKGWIYSGQYYYHKMTKSWTLINYINYLIKEEKAPSLRYPLHQCCQLGVLRYSSFFKWSCSVSGASAAITYYLNLCLFSMH